MIASGIRKEWERKAAVLKQYELHCYQICYYLLQSEAKALQAAVASIEHLIRDAAFFCKPDPDKLEIVRKTAIRYSLNYSL